MPTPTPNIGLQQATTTDDLPTYLTAATTSLATSLTTIDTLFGATGHNHSGAGTGAPVTQVQDPYTQPIIATPTTFPPAGSLRIYPKADTLYYKIDSAGVETLLAPAPASPSEVEIGATDPITLNPISELWYDTTAGAGLGVLKARVGAAWEPVVATGGLTLPLTVPLTFSPDNTHDIGAAAASRPKDLYLGGRANVGSVVVADAGPATPSFLANGISAFVRDVAIQGNLVVASAQVLTGTMTQGVQTVKPANAPASSFSIYPKVDGYYQIDSLGVETPLYTSGAAAVPPTALTGSMHQIGSTMIDQIIAALVTHGIVDDTAVTP